MLAQFKIADEEERNDEHCITVRYELGNGRGLCLQSKSVDQFRDQFAAKVLYEFQVESN